MIIGTLLIWVALLPALPPKQPPPPVPGYDWAAPKKRAGEPAPPPVAPDKVVAEFLKFIDGRNEYPKEAKAFLVKKRAETPPEALAEFIGGAYSILSPDYKHALELVDADKSAEAAAVFEKLAKSDDPYLAVAAANLGATAFIDLDLIERCGTMLDGVMAAHKPIENFTTASDHFRFMLGYCQVHNLKYELAYGTFEDFLKNHPNAPERLRTTAAQILTELASRLPGQIGDVRDLLTYARRRIKTGATDDDVILKQKEAVALLETLISDAEQQEKNQSQSQSESQRNQEKKSSKPEPGGGAKKSSLPEGPAGPTRLRKTAAKPGEAWGKMPPREREQVLQTLQKQFPSQYRELLEQYYKQLSKDTPPP